MHGIGALNIARQSSSNPEALMACSTPAATPDELLPSSSAGNLPRPPSLQNPEKLGRLWSACKTRDRLALIDLACSRDGLMTDEIRRAAWPMLLGADGDDKNYASDLSQIPRHKDEDQVELDVNRSFVYYPNDESEQRLQVRKRELSHVITSVLRHHPVLCYFQGYHDIVQVLLLVLGPEAAVPAVARLSLLRIRDFMLPTLSAAETHLHLLPAILYATDLDLYNHLAGASRPTPFFALAATLTLYAHDIEEYGNIARLFDFLLATEASVPVYLFAVIVMSRKKELLEIDRDEPEMLHSILSKLPKPLNLEGLVTETQRLFKRCPPERLPNRAWRRVSSNSVLKTTRDSHALVAQSLEDGERFFAKQETEIRRQEMITAVRQRAYALAYRYRRPVRWTGAAVLVALIALYAPESATQRLVYISQRILALVWL